MSVKITKSELRHLAGLRVNIQAAHFEYHCEVVEVWKRIGAELDSRSERWRNSRSGDHARALLEDLETIADETMDYPSRPLEFR